MEYSPLVSIVIPAYNASNYLAEAIESALAQTYQNIEIIVVNDGSRDDGATEGVALSYGSKIRYFSKENGGSSSAMNIGIENMHGEWFSWLSHDDLYKAEKIQKQIDYLREVIALGDEPTQYVLFTANEFIDEKGMCVRRSIPEKELQKAKEINSFLNNDWLITDQVKKYAFHGCSCLIHRTVFEKTGKFDESIRYLNDFDMFFRVFRDGYKIRYIPQCLVQGRVHSKQVSRAIGFSYHNEEQDRYWRQVYDYLLEITDAEKWDELMLTYASTATEKTRWQDGNRAFYELKRRYPDRKLKYCLIELKCMIYGSLRTFVKKVYILIFMRK